MLNKECSDIITTMLIIKSRFNQLFCKEEIKTIINLIAKSLGLEYYINDIEFISNNNFASYNFYSKKIKVNPTLCYSDTANFPRVNNTVFEKNVNMLCSILHEFEHIIQNKNIDTNFYNSEMEKEVVFSELRSRVKQEDKKYDNLLKSNSVISNLKALYEFKRFIKRYEEYDSYISLYTERQANIASFLQCIEILEKINTKESMILREAYIIEMGKIALEGYEEKNSKMVCPFVTCLDNLKAYNPNLKTSLFNDKIIEKLPLSDKLLYGFKISKEEYKELYLKVYGEYPENKGKKQKQKV